MTAFDRAWALLKEQSFDNFVVVYGGGEYHDPNDTSEMIPREHGYFPTVEEAKANPEQAFLANQLEKYLGNKTKSNISRRRGL